MTEEELLKIINKHTEGNYLLSSEDKAKIVRDIIELFSKGLTRK